MYMYLETLYFKFYHALLGNQLLLKELACLDKVYLPIYLRGHHTRIFDDRIYRGVRKGSGPIQRGQVVGVRTHHDNAR